MESDALATTWGSTRRCQSEVKCVGSNTLRLQHSLPVQPGDKKMCTLLDFSVSVTPCNTSFLAVYTGQDGQAGF